MLQYLEILKPIIPMGITLERKEVIRRCRSLKKFDATLLSILQMTDFFMLSRNEKGEISVV